ncbi:MAG: TolC family protein, partial [Limnobacter sp.]
MEQSKSWMPGTESCAIKADQGKNLSLTKTLQIVLCQHPQLVEARARIEEQMAEVNLSKLERRPDVQTVLQYTAEKDRQANFSDATRKGVTAGLSANWVLFDFGQQSANIRAANRQLDSAIAFEKSVSLTVLREALEQYISASTAWANLVAAQKTLKIAQRTEEFARARYESKVGNQIDQLQAKTAVHQAQLGLLQAQGEWEDAKTTLAVAMGLPEQK